MLEEEDPFPIRRRVSKQTEEKTEGSLTASKQKLSSKGEVVDFTKVFVGGLPKDIKKHEVKEYFAQFGPVSKILLKKTKNKEGKCVNKGFGFVIFKDEGSAQRSLDRPVHFIGDSRVDVKHAILSTKKPVKQTKLTEPKVKPIFSLDQAPKIGFGLFDLKNFNRTTSNNYYRLKVSSKVEFDPFE